MSCRYLVVVFTQLLDTNNFLFSITIEGQQYIYILAMENGIHSSRGMS